MHRCITFYPTNAQAVTSHNFDEAPFFLFEGEIVDNGFDALPPDGYELPAKFPNCCKYHPKILTHLLSWFDRFPNCCEWHKEISQKIWFQKDDFNGLPLKIIKNLFFTVEHIGIKANAHDWQKEITDYIEYNLASFGSPALGSNFYLDYLKNYIKQKNPPLLSKEKRVKVLEYIAEQTVSTAITPVDLNALHATFQTWLKSIPDLIIFDAFKKKYSNKIPIDFLFYSTEYNPYLGQTKAKVRTRKQLIKLLLNFTKDALYKVDSSLLLENGTITDIAKHQLDIANGKRKLKQSTLLGRFSKGELKYLDVMKEWLLTEDEYFTSVASLLHHTDLLPHISRTGRLEASTTINNNINLGDKSALHLIQGEHATQNNVSGDNAAIGLGSAPRNS